ncbi:MAG: hypothetical protein ABIU96_06295 [Rhodanobacter sp.]
MQDAKKRQSVSRRGRLPVDCAIGVQVWVRNGIDLPRMDARAAVFLRRSAQPFGTLTTAAQPKF